MDMDVQTQPHARKPIRPDDPLVQRIVTSYAADERTQHLDSTFLPNRARAIEIIELMRRIVFPGFFDEQRLTTQTIATHLAELLEQVKRPLFQQINEALRYEQNRVGGAGQGDDCDDCERQAEQSTDAFLNTIPEIRRLLATDVQAAYDGDPAAVNTDETIFCYPGLDAIFIYRVAHELYKLNVPLLPRIMTEYAHNETGIDIHPGAAIGESFFIDHGTGVVIGETTQIGRHVQIYQGVTLGALAPKDGDKWRGRKRHPTIGNDVVIYPNATILGGETVVGDGCVINGLVFLVESVAPNHTVAVHHPQPVLKARRTKPRQERGEAS